MLIGMTERGDAGLDLSWESKLPEVDGAIIITKCIATPAFQNAILHNQDHIILHADITGNGGTIYEPNVIPYTKSFNALQDLLDKGFPASHVVLRCDPIIPTNDGLENMRRMFTEFLKRDFGINRVRISVLDNYPHVRKRFEENGLYPLYNGYFQPLPSQFFDIAMDLTLIFKDHPEISIECCAEPKLTEISKQWGFHPVEHVGCCSEKDLKILGLPIPADMTTNPQNRKGCLCLAAKKELLTNPHPCPHKCIYCYWKG